MNNGIYSHVRLPIDINKGAIADTHKFNKYYVCLYASVHRYGIRMLNDDFTIDNIVQEAFLKLWNYRETITSQEHALRFLRQNVKWECYAYFRNPVSRFNRRFTYLDAIEDYDTVLGLCEPLVEDDEDAVTESQLKAIKDMIPFLSHGRERNLLQLYYIDGLSYKQIALRYNITVTAASLDVRKGVEKLKTMLVRPQKLFAEPFVAHTTDVNQRIWLYDIEGLSKEQSQIYRLRSESKYSFERIAVNLDLPQAYVQREYVKAWKLVSLQKKKGSQPAYVDAAAHKPVTFLIA
ncbi:sigma-70 family RNA polymerase sigma factor [Mucilaginibacter sp. Bleaf8]|uniref:RNA polymerase sigma factor n=1 Tax=Mucilaginibacter sp. Bleaf8 TaxID=2834430 RepID=UPI001BCC6B0B|nr:sigma-70 family RNA polymerase sigma factor [Mucilaginibacter sp. Bleaf8]MBS7565646.1 sigma-70 family RNA polymerase sigma factor [Mucilaginibacter sp. Bleaf8]